MPSKSPDVIYRPAERLQRTFAPGTALTTSTAISQLIAIPNCVGWAARILSTAAGSLAAAYADPSARMEVAAGIDTIYTTVGTNAAYATGKPRLSPVAVTANTEAILQATSFPVYNGTTVLMPDYNGESFLLLTFTPSGNGTLTWCDFCQITRGV